jgi:Flp pilus assembly pilin Flp
LFGRFVKSERGAITVDWVVITATAIGLAIGGLSMFQSNVTTVSSATGDSLEDYNNDMDW